MSKHFSKKPLALALGAAFTLAGGAAQASVFQASDLAGGYMVAAGGDKAAEHKCGEAKCGANCMKDMQGKGMSEADSKTACEKAMSEGKCGSAKEKSEGKCGGKMGKEGKCGEGKCGTKK